jgi:hypothetical protein
VPTFHFIPPCSPIPTKVVPVGYDWVHEVKFDGYRVVVGFGCGIAATIRVQRLFAAIKARREHILNNRER